MNDQFFLTISDLSLQVGRPLQEQKTYTFPNFCGFISLVKFLFCLHLKIDIWERLHLPEVYQANGRTVSTLCERSSSYNKK